MINLSLYRKSSADSPESFGILIIFTLSLFINILHFIIESWNVIGTVIVFWLSEVPSLSQASNS